MSIHTHASDRHLEHAPFIALADDDDDLRDALTTALQQDGFRVAEFPDGHRLIAYLSECDASTRPDMLIIDHRMPGYSGVEILEGLQASGWGLPVIVITAFGADARALATSLGATAVFDKPFDVDDLRTAVYSALNGEHA